MNKSIRVSLLNIEKDTSDAIKLIEKFRAINNMNFNIHILYDYSMIDNHGFYEYDGKKTKTSKIYINPSNCYIETLESRQRVGFIEDYTIYSTILHEFGHFLDFKFDISSDYDSQNFQPINLGAYAKTDIVEEFAELVVLYLVNPYFLKIIDKDRFKFLKKRFKSPSPCTKCRFMKLYNKWHENAKMECYKDFGISVENNEVI